MKLDAVRAYSLEIPFKTTFRHASADRATTQTLWVEASANGHVGYGEGCPREYVTGESLQSASAFFRAHCDDWRSAIGDVESLRKWCAGHAQDIDRNPAAWAAVELALLDLFAKREHVTVDALLGLPALAGSFRYTAVLGDSAPPQFAAQLERYLAAGFTDFKVKLSGDSQRDREKVRILTEGGVPGASVRADANNLWSSADAAIEALHALDFRFSALEEPLRAGDYAGLARLARAVDTRMILDESVARAGQLEYLEGPPGRWIVNLRVSKMGGLLRSLALVNELRRRCLGLIVGAHVGETSVLTRAALTIANAARDVLIAQEGAFGTHLLQRDVVQQPLAFGVGGVLRADRIAAGAAGWALDVAVDQSDLATLPAA
jgi:L-Ala-D/L-Glu epimerase